MKRTFSNNSYLKAREFSFFDLTSIYQLIDLKGQDCRLFLHSITTQDIKNISVGGNKSAAILQKNSKIIALFNVVCLSECHWILIAQKSLVEKIYQYLDNYLFSEDVQIKTVKSHLFYIQGTKIKDFIPEKLYKQIRFLENNLLKLYQVSKYDSIENIYYLSIAFTGDESCLISVSNPITMPKWLEKLNQLHSFDTDLFHLMRGENKILKWEDDVNEDYLILEVDDNQNFVHLNKGCYPGQETVARVLSRGKLQKKLIQIVSNEELMQGSTLYYKDIAVVWIKSVFFSFSQNQFITFAYYKQTFFEQNNLKVGEMITLWKLPVKDKKEIIDKKNKIKIKIITKPIYESLIILEKTKQLYEEGMKKFHSDEFNCAKTTFKKILHFKPTHIDAIEALSVIYERENDIVKAINLNKSLTQIDACLIMPHTNLSRLYMKQGLIEKAEEEKNIATRMGYQKTADLGNSISQNISKDTLETHQDKKRIDTFYQVLEIDPMDEIAHFSLGKFFFEKKQLNKAIDHLKKVIEQNELYTFAYILLGKSFTTLNENKKAKGMFDKGLMSAKKNGEMALEKEIKNELSKL